MFRFTIRDVLWLMVVVAFAVLWQMEIRQRHIENPPDLSVENAQLRQELVRAKENAKGATMLIHKLQSQIDGEGPP